MKKISILLITLLITSVSFSQTYFKFPTSNTIWNYKIVGSLSYPYEWPVIDSLGQPTTIGSNQYIEVYRAAQGNCNIIGAIREDTLQRKIYFHNYTDEIILYDFTLDIGDTIYYSTNLYYNLDYYKVVDFIDSVNVSGQYRKRWHLTNSYMSMTDTWIEGIGSVYRYGLLYPNDPDLVLDASNPYFGCFSHDTITYMDGSNCYGTCPCTDWLVEISEIDKNSDGVNIFPNPTENIVTIEISNENLNYDYIELFTYNGGLVDKFKINSKKLEINMNSLKKGLYYIKLTGNEKTILKRVIKN